VSDSQIIKAALLLAQPDKRLLTAHREIKGADQRYKQEPKEEQVCGGRCQPNGSVVSGLRLFVAYVVIRLLLQTGQLAAAPIWVGPANMSPADRKVETLISRHVASRSMAQYVACFAPKPTGFNIPGSALTCPAARLIDGDEHPISFQDGAGNSQMPDKTYLVRFKEPGLAPQLVRAASVEIHGEHLVFLRASGELSAMFLFEIVKDWSEIDI